MIRLFIMNGPEQGKGFESEKETLFLGRSSSNDVAMVDRSVSRRHLRISKRSDRYYIEDLKSANGTFVNGKRISPFMEIEVPEGDPVAVGKVFFTFGRSYTGDISSFRESMDISRRLVETDRIEIGNSVETDHKNLKLIYDVSRVLMQSSDIHEILQKVLNTIFEYFRTIERGIIILVDGDTGEVSEVIPRFTKDMDKTLTIYSRAIVDRVRQEASAVIMSDTDFEKEIDLSESMRLLKIRSVMCVPLISRSRIRGVIYVDSVDRPYGFTKEDLSFLTTLSGPAAVAIENALLYSNLEKILKKGGETPKKEKAPAN